MKAKIKKLDNETDLYGVLYYIITGMIIGTASILPAFSGGGMAVALNIYDKLIFTANECLRIIKYIFLPQDNFLDKYIENKEKNKKYNFFERLILAVVAGFKNYGKFVLSITAGVIISMIILAKFLKHALEVKPLFVTAIFLGLLLGTVPKMIKEAKTSVDKKIKKNNNNKSKIYNICIFFLTTIVVSITTLRGESLISTGISYEFANTDIIMMLIVGALIALFSIIPGVSWALVLMLIGKYEAVLKVIDNFDALKLVIIFIGIILAAIPLVKLMERLLENYKQKTFYGVLGFVMASIIKIVADIFILTKIQGKELIILIILTLFSAIISYVFINFFEKIENKKTKVKQINN